MFDVKKKIKANQHKMDKIFVNKFSVNFHGDYGAAINLTNAIKQGAKETISLFFIHKYLRRFVTFL